VPRFSLVVGFAGVLVLASAAAAASADRAGSPALAATLQMQWLFGRGELGRLARAYSVRPRSPTGPAPTSHVLLTVAPIPTRSMPHPGTPLVRWSTGNGSPGRVTVEEGDGPERLFAIAAAGSAGAPWIQPDSSYVFRLYSIGARTRLL